jgi:MGT family glycosyltransferase
MNSGKGRSKSMSKVIFLNPPAHGHVNPTLPVAQELVERGEQVIYYNTEEFRPQIERTGAMFRAYPATELSATEISKQLQEGNLSKITPLLLRTTETLLPFVLDELRREQPDLVIFDSIAAWGKMASTLLNLRAAAFITHFMFEIGYGPRMSLGEILMMLRQGLPQVPSILAARSRLIRRYGKAAFPPSGPLFPMRDKLNIVFTARELQPDIPLIDDSFRFVGPSLDPQARYEDFPFEIVGQQSIIYISLGTVHHAQSDFYQQCFAAFGDYPAQFILSAGKHTDIGEIRPVPSNFMVRPFVPQIAVLQRVDAFITHGGMNSIHEGLYYAVPLVLIPQQIEQLLNARCVAAQGAGLVIEDQLKRGHVTASTLRQSLEKVLSEASYKQGASKVQEMLRATGGYRQAADEIQSYVAADKGLVTNASC